MVSLDETESLVLQRFVSKDGKLLAELATHICPESGLRYVLWSDIQHKFADMRCLRGRKRILALFMINTENKL